MAATADPDLSVAHDLQAPPISPPFEKKGSRSNKAGFKNVPVYAEALETIDNDAVAKLAPMRRCDVCALKAEEEENSLAGRV